MYILARTPADAVRIRKMLEKAPPTPLSRFYDFDIDDIGMTTEYLV